MSVKSHIVNLLNSDIHRGSVSVVMFYGNSYLQRTGEIRFINRTSYVDAVTRNICKHLVRCDDERRGPFIATQLNSTSS